jgi:hypothetical protein
VNDANKKPRERSTKFDAITRSHSIRDMAKRARENGHRIEIDRVRSSVAVYKGAGKVILLVGNEALETLAAATTTVATLLNVDIEDVILVEALSW